jgi:ribonucleoside-diphosphate reductase alpha chain
MAATKRSRPKSLAGKTYKAKTGCGNMFVTINEDEAGLFEVFVRFGKGGGCSSTIGESIGRLVTLAFRTGGTMDEVIKQISGITCHQQLPKIGDDPAVLSCVDALGQVLKGHKEKK